MLGYVYVGTLGIGEYGCGLIKRLGLDGWRELRNIAAALVYLGDIAGGFCNPDVANPV